jgi:hypothetical protein
MGYKIASTDGDIAGECAFDTLPNYGDLSGNLSGMLDILTGHASSNSGTDKSVSYTLKKFVKHIKY